MKKLILAVAVSAAFSVGCAYAEESKVEAKPEHEVSFNAALTSDYRYRGISQKRLQAAVQGGADYTHTPSGLYAGAWLSTIKWTKDAGGSGDVEVDLYAGKRGEIAKDLSYDVGVLTYVYPSNGLMTDANTTEVYGQIGYGPVYAKYSYAVTNLFGIGDSKNSGYLDLGANIEVAAGLTLNLHAGRQQVKNTDAASYTDWKIGVTKDFGSVTGALAVIGTNANEVAYASPANGKFLGKTALLATVSKTF
ncbi:TorF family putative porin [Undibacterium sp.]|uniref:TorF family putative porin n=1 Tax=Undibacterium sp. TaxID=1914977 RepID=UPI0025CBCE99|nr:TorF family putative porin [Undibacterium sp.]